MKKLLTLLISLTAFFSYSQGYIFSVLANKGSNQVQQGTTWNTIKAGTKIYKGNSVKVSSTGYVDLIHKSGKTIELKQNGTFSIIELEGMLASKTSSFTEKYAKFAINTDSDDANKRSYNVTGSVERALPGLSGSFDLLLKDSITVLKNIPLTISWLTSEENITKTVDLKIQNLYGDYIYETKSSGTSATLDLSKLDTKEETLIVSLYDPETEEPLTSGKKVVLVEGEQEATIKNEFDALVKELDLTNSSVDNVLLSSFFKENKYNDYAIACMKHAHDLSPDVPTYSNLYYALLEENGIVEESSDTTK